MGLLSWIFGQNRKTPKESEGKRFSDERLNPTPDTDRERELARAGRFDGSHPTSYATHRPVDGMVHTVRQPVLRRHEDHVSGDIEYKVFVYDGRPLRHVKDGSRFVAQIAAKPVRMVSTLTGTPWDGRHDDGIAFTFDGKPFGVSFNEDFASYLRSTGASSIDMVRRGWYDRKGNIPEVRALAPSTRRRNARTVSDRKPLTPQLPRPVNAKPDAVFVDGIFPVDVTGEEKAQDALAKYGPDTWVWATLTVGEQPNGKYKGQPTIDAWIDGTRIGCTTHLQAERHLKRVQGRKPRYCRATIVQGKNKLELQLLLPGKDQ